MHPGSTQQAPLQSPQHSPKRLALTGLKATQQQTWASGDYAQVGATLQIVGEQLAEAANVYPGQTVLDVAAGNGNFSMAAARRFSQVTSTDFVPALLEKGRIRALAEGYDIRFKQADAEALPIKDNSFDLVGSVFGVMFTPNQQQAADEMQRVCRPGGTIALANWTPQGFIGRLFKLLGAYRTSPLDSPALWGTEEHLERLFRTPVEVERCFFNFRYYSPQSWLTYFKQVYGPLRNTYGALEPADQHRLDLDILQLVEDLNQAGDGTMRVPGEYLQVVITNPV